MRMTAALAGMAAVRPRMPVLRALRTNRLSWNKTPGLEPGSLATDGTRLFGQIRNKMPRSEALLSTGKASLFTTKPDIEPFLRHHGDIWTCG